MAAGNVFGPARPTAFGDRLVVGSVKSNMGHLEGACALPGILKVVAALEAGEIPATLGFKTPNLRIDFDKAKARVNTDVEPWPKNRPKRASVTSAGFGGTNGHCVIGHVHNVLPLYLKPGIVSQRMKKKSGTHGHVAHENNGHATDGPNGHLTHGISGDGANETQQQLQHCPAIDTQNMIMKPDAGTRQLVVLPFSAHNQASLNANMIALSQVIHRHSMADVAYTLAVKRSRFTQRTFCIVDKDQAVQAGLGQDAKVYSSSQPVCVGFTFTGQGAQWHGMGAELFEYSVFRDTIAYLDRILGIFPHPVSWKIADVLSGKCEKDLVQMPAVSQTVCTALQIGLVDLLASWSIRPAGTVGHSSGEMAAAYTAGRITAAEAITAAYYRGYIVSFNKQKGAMLAVGMSLAQGAKYIQEVGLKEKTKIAAMNSPDSITISGDARAIEELSAKMSQEAIFNRILRTGGLAYHSHHMLPLGHTYTEVIDSGKKSLEENGIHDERQKYPIIPWFSSVTPSKDTIMPGQRVPTSYWRANLESPVHFAEAVSNLLNFQGLEIGAVIEIGPHPAMKSPVTQIVKALGKTVPHLASLKRAEDGRRCLLDLAGTLFALNANVNLVAVNAVDELGGKLAHGSTAIDLPPYQYTYGPINYHESRLSKEYRLRKVPRHDLLGSKIAGTTRLRPQWRQMLRLKDLPWLNDHRIPPHVLHPGAAHIVMAMLAAEQAYNEFPGALPVTGITLRNVSIKKTLVVPEDDHGIEIVLSMELEDGATATSPVWASFSISSVVRDTEQWTEHCAGLAKVEVAAFEQISPIDTTMDGRIVDAETWYKRFAEMGLQFGPSFQGYSDIRADPSKNVASAKLALKTTAGMFPGGESEYPIHPASLDLVIRLGLMACNGGQAETGSVQLPIHLDQMRFKLGGLHNLQWATGLARGELRGLRGAYAQLQMLSEMGDVILDVDNMRYIDLSNEQQSSSAVYQARKAYSSPFNRLVWRPDIRTLRKEQSSAVLRASEDKTGAFPQLSNVFDLMGHANPNLRILQLRASNDLGVSQIVLKTLVGSNGIKRYREYLMTDISQDLLTPSRSEFRDTNYSVLDIEKHPLEQGFQPIYDIVLSVNAVSASPSMQKALGNCEKLLRPGGKLILLESTERDWDEAMLKAGFKSGAELVVNEHNFTLIMGTRHDTEMQPIGRSPVVHLLHDAKGAPALLNHLAQEFERRGLSTKAIRFDDAWDALLPNSRVIAFLDGENLLLSADQHRIGLFQHLAATTTSMIWLTSCGIVKGRNPDGAFVSGLLRTLGSENPAGHFLSVDIDVDDFQLSDKELGELAHCLVEKELALHPENGDNEVNREFVWQDGCLWVSRIVPDGKLQGYAAAVTTPDDHELEIVPLSTQGPVRAAFGTAGILTSLYFRPYLELLQPLPRNWIQVKVLAVGLNWKDLGLCTGRFDQNNLSNEYCGIVTKRGPDVSHVEVGDRVYGMGKGHFGNYTHVPAALAHKLRPDVDAVEAATMPLVYMTAVYAFEHVTRLRKGQKVLIQSASGGLGLAAIQLARVKGAEIFVTAGSAQKTRYLTEQVGIPSTHVFSSRDSSDLKRMIRATQNGGFDVILSNSQGHMLYESIKALAPLGHLIDVGRLDVTSSKNIALELFQKSASFTSFDLGLVVERDVELGRELIQSMDEYYTAGRIGPIRPYTALDISQLGQILLRFSKGTHIGKMVVSYQDPNSMIRKHKSVTPTQFDPEARYILIGGLSDLGRSIVRFMSDRGARNLVVWSRSGPNNLSPEAQILIDELAAKRVRVQPVACDVSNHEQVIRAVQDAKSDRTVRGVLHFAVSYHDISFDKMTAEMFHKGMSAKVVGTKNLHEATASLPLEFFTMISSFGTFYAFPTQSIYVAANNFMEYFARYRRRYGLPASTVSLNFISDLGAVSQDAVTVNLFARAKGQKVTGSQVLRMLEPAFMSHRDHHDAHQQWLGHSQDPLSEANIVTGIDPAVLAFMKQEEIQAAKTTSSSGSIPRWYYDARVSMMLRALDDACRYQAGDAAKAMQDLNNTADGSPVAQLRRQFHLSIHRIGEQDGDDKAAEHCKAVASVTDAIRDAVAGMLFTDPLAISVVNTMVEHGIDSLLAAEFRNWLHSVFGKNISMLDLMDTRTNIDALARDIVDEATRS